MTHHMRDLIRSIAWDGRISGPVLEIGSYIEANQEHLNLRRAFVPGSPYLGVDVIPGPGVDRVANLLEPSEIGRAYEEAKPSVIACLYVLEHLWDIRGAAKALVNLWKRNTESWLFVSTHQNQPFHGTDKYPDYWRITGPGMQMLFKEAGTDVSVFLHPDRQNPEDVFAVRQPLSNPWTAEKMGDSVRSVAAHWERHC